MIEVKAPSQEMVEAGLACVSILSKLVPPNLDEKGIRFIDPMAKRQEILALENAMLNMAGAKLKIETTHRWIDGVYVREVFIPKGTILTGRIHKHACVSIMNKGDKTTVDEDGARRIKAPFATISKPGIKRLGIAHEDTIWTTIHATNERDLEKLEQELFTDSYEGVAFKDADVLTLVTMEGKCQL